MDGGQLSAGPTQFVLMSTGLAVDDAHVRLDRCSRAVEMLPQILGDQSCSFRLPFRCFFVLRTFGSIPGSRRTDPFAEVVLEAPRD